MIDSEKSKLAFQKQKQADLHCSDLFTFRPLSAPSLPERQTPPQSPPECGPILWLWNSTLSPLSEFSPSKSATSRRCGARLALGG
ncbi:unnamed protein product [Prunus armeniaca]